MSLVTKGHSKIWRERWATIFTPYGIWRLVASGVRVESEEIRCNIVQPDYQDIINKSKTLLKNNARICFRIYIEKRVPDLHSADGWKTVKEKFLTYFNPVGSTKEQQMKAWKEMVCKSEEEKLTDFVFRFSQTLYCVYQKDCTYIWKMHKQYQMQ